MPPKKNTKNPESLKESIEDVVEKNPIEERLKEPRSPDEAIIKYEAFNLEAMDYLLNHPDADEKSTKYEKSRW